MFLLRIARSIVIASAISFLQASASIAQDRPKDDRPPPPRKTGLILNTDAAFNGYTLFAPLNSTQTYLIDMTGKIVHQWKSQFDPGQSVYLLNDGHLLRTERQPHNTHFEGGGIGGRIERIAPDGTVAWQFVYADANHCAHHDVAPLPNGHILMIAWEKKTRDQAIAAGRDPKQIRSKEMWPDHVIEIEPAGKNDAKIVWEWHAWDHLIQSIDKSKPNFGVVADHPELIDINFTERAPRESAAEMNRLRSLGYVGGGDEPADDHPEDDDNDREPRAGGREGPPDENDGPPDGNRRHGPPGFDRHADWCHTNAITYNPALDQIALSIHNFNEIWIIDHSTTTANAAGHQGGRFDKGGDLLYRWGNSRAYGAGSARDQQLFAQHDVRWIPEGCPGAGHLTVFNNGEGRRSARYSSIVELLTPITDSDGYQRAANEPFGPIKPCWIYSAKPKTDFFASHISGAHRLPNGNTLICDGEQGRIFEVTPAGKTVWDYISPFSEDRGPNPRRGPGDGSPDRRGPRPPRRGPGRFGPGGPHGGPGGIFRASRLSPDHPGIKALLTQTNSNSKSEK